MLIMVLGMAVIVVAVFPKTHELSREPSNPTAFEKQCFDRGRIVVWVKYRRLCLAREDVE